MLFEVLLFCVIFTILLFLAYCCPVFFIPSTWMLAVIDVMMANDRIIIPSQSCTYPNIYAVPFKELNANSESKATYIRLRKEYSHSCTHISGEFTYKSPRNTQRNK